MPQWLRYTDADMENAIANNSKNRGNANQQAAADARGLPPPRRRSVAQPGQYAEIDADGALRNQRAATCISLLSQELSSF